MHYINFFNFFLRLRGVERKLKINLRIINSYFIIKVYLIFPHMLLIWN